MRKEVGRLGKAAAGSQWQETALWQALEAMRIEPPGAALSFIGRLANEHGWHRSFAEAVYREYLRFLYLSATSKTPLTPSEEVDQAWHLHLAYSRHYWNVLCKEIVKRPFHHGPTAGGSAEAARHRTQYEDTLVRYREAFGTPPPEIWPAAAVRFSARPLWVDRSAVWVLPKRRARSAVLVTGLAALTAACAAGDLGPAERFIVLIALIVVGFGIVVGLLSRGRRRREEGGSGCGGGGYDGGDGDGGGCGGCGGD